MKVLLRPVLIFSLRVYVAVVLMAAVVISPPALSVIPVAILLVYLFMWWRNFNGTAVIMTDLFIFFTITILMAQSVNRSLSFIPSLPVLLLLNQHLQSAGPQEHRLSRYHRSFTRISWALLSTIILTMLVALLLGSLPLLLAAGSGLVYLVVLLTVILRKMPAQPVVVEPVQQRMVAGSKYNISIDLNSETGIGRSLYLESPYDWLKVNTPELLLSEKRLTAAITLMPVLSGPSVVRLQGFAFDKWGLTQTEFGIGAFQLYIIPRARYATWLAKKYLAETRAGTLPLISNVGMTKPMFGLRRGIEYYGSQLYQPGDNLRNIDWKHSIKYNKLITKEFADFHGQEAILLVNLAVSNAEEADKLAYNTIVAAVSLAREQIPTALAVYNDKKSVMVTATLPPRQVVTQSLEVVKEIVMIDKLTKYLNPPDITRLRANISRLRDTDSQASRTLRQLLQIEFASLKDAARSNPATRALSTVLAKTGKQSCIVVVSQFNHDAEAIMFNSFTCTARGNSVIMV